jgi:UPF0755 protein
MNNKNNKIILIILAVVVLIIISIVIFIGVNLKKPISNNNQEYFFEITEGQSTAEIANNLQNKGFIKYPWLFTIYNYLNHKVLMPGMYYLKTDMSLTDIVSNLVKGNVAEKKITIPEGWTNKQIAEYLEKNNIVTQDAFLAAAQDKEGYLFPDTYRISVKATAPDIVEKMENNFQTKTKDLKIDANTIILASIVEKETKTPEDRRIVAGVYQKRLNLGMKMESCPTVLYALGVIKDQLSSQDIKTDSPYNTYVYTGLPPGPICNPGLDSIKAVLEPTKTDYLFFLSDKDGNLHFAKTAVEHAANKQKYGL